MSRKKKNNNRQVWNGLIMVLQFGINMLVPIFMLTFLGVFIGKKTGATWVTVPLFFVGALAGFNNIYRIAKKTISDEEKENDNDRHAKKNK